MAHFDPTIHPHRRFNPLTNEHVLVSPHRTRRPWLGQTETPAQVSLPPYDPACYLCPGNERAGGDHNPPFIGTHVFENDFAAILPPPAPLAPPNTHPLLTIEPVDGACDVLIFHHRHDLTLSRLTVDEVKRVVLEWTKVYERRGQEEGIKYVQIFENKGAMMGCSNPHPHGQIWSLSTVPSVPAVELAALKRYSMSNSSANAPLGCRNRPCLLCEYAYFESQLALREGRAVVSNEHWIALVPWWAVWPYEILMLPYKRHIPSLSELTAEEVTSFAELLSNITIRYDNLFSCSFAYSMGIHQRPIPPRDPSKETRSDEIDDFAHLHVHFYPPLLRSATIRKFLVGYVQ
ncbi:galactose-1-phosphate uridylyltransferase [Rickenella mellea]|uniref:Galactose-1-phosphate uridylyltransferase n=1 Tax=Rickenella mellea TaxID=50990 RepID=A0A4Y7QBM9_9AGAM|nr:galactose-1-phosphate uridylyltransferase [Rickenella mellea]